MLRRSSATTPANGNAPETANAISIIEQAVSRLSVAPPAPAAPVRKWMHVRVGHRAKVRKLAWYDPCEAQAMDMMLRAACGVAPSQQYLLLDTDMSAVAVASTLPSDSTFELVVLGAAPGRESKQAAVVVIDPISTGAVLCYQLVHERHMAVIAVWSDVVPDDLKSFVDSR